MFSTVRFGKKNGELAKKLFEIRTVSLPVKKNYSQQENLDDFYKYYSDEVYYDDRYKPLSGKDYDRFISSKAARREPMVTRQITSLAYKVGKQMISLAEGMPNNGVFPFTRLTMETRSGGALELTGKDLTAALQYVPSQGLPPLLTEIRDFQEYVHRPPQLPRDVLVLNGSQHGIYQCVELIMEPGDPVITTEFTYSGIHSCLRPYQPEIISIPEDEDGLIPETLDSVLGERLRRGLKMPKMMYVIPNGNNPSGTVIPEDRRRQIYELSCKYDFLIIEDDPYMFLSYTDTRAPSFLSLDTHGRVIRLDSVSKVVSAGLRGAWVTAPAPLYERLELHMQAELLHSCTLSQAILLQILKNRSSLARQLIGARELYHERRDALHAALEPISDLAQYSLPKAGLYMWARLNGVSDVFNMVFHTALQRGLMLTPGHAFRYDSSTPCQHVRLTFSRIRHEDMGTAVRLLTDLIREEQQAILLQILKNRSSLARQLIGARELYHERRDALHAALEPISDLAHYSLPKAGLYMWARLNGVSDVFNMVFHTALQRGLMLTPGHAFRYDSSTPCQHVRLTFSRIRHEDMGTAVRLLTDLIREEQQVKTKRYGQ